MNTPGGAPLQEVEVNITPIIDCFTVLVTFLLASAGFLSIGFFESSTPGTASAVPPAPTTEIIVRILERGHLELVVKGKNRGKFRFSFDTPEGSRGLERELGRIAARGKDSARILLTAPDRTAFDLVAKVLDHLNPSGIPVVIGEFEEGP